MKITLHLGLIFLLHVAVVLSVTVFENTTLACVDVPALSSRQQCLFVQTSCNTDEYQIGAFDYLSCYYCSPARAFPTIFFCGVVVVCFVSLAVTAGNYLCPNLYSISKLLELSDNMAGLTLLALGNGLADVMSTYEALEVGATGLAVSELLGAAFFILTVVVGAISVVSPFKVPKVEFLRDSTFYLAVLLVIMCSLLAGHFNYYNSTLLVLIYVIYVIVVVYSHSFLAGNQQLNVNLSRLRSHYDEAWVEPSEPVPDLVEPSIETLESHEDIDEYEAFLKSVGGSELQVPIETGSYGLKVLLKGLSKHTTKHASHGAQSPLRLTNERQLSVGPPAEETNQDISQPEVVLYKNIWRMFFPVYEEDAAFHMKIMYCLSFPANMALRLTTPNRDEAINHIQSHQSNAFSFDSMENLPAEEDYGQPSSSEFRTDVRIYKIQFVMGPIWLVTCYLHKEKLFFPYLLLVLATFAPISYFAPDEIPQSVLQLRLFKMWNYCGSFLGFLVSILWISMFATEIVAILKASAVILSLSDDIIGATIFAWGNSVGDLISNLMIAQMGMPLMAFGACFGGPLLAICALGAISMMVMRLSGSTEIPVRFSSSLKINCLSLIMVLVCLLIAVPRNAWAFDKKIGAALIGVWALSVTAVVLAETFQ